MERSKVAVAWEIRWHVKCEYLDIQFICFCLGIRTVRETKIGDLASEIAANQYIACSNIQVHKP